MDNDGNDQPLSSGAWLFHAPGGHYPYRSSHNPAHYHGLWVRPHLVWGSDDHQYGGGSNYSSGRLESVYSPGNRPIRASVTDTPGLAAFCNHFIAGNRDHQHLARDSPVAPKQNDYAVRVIKQVTDSRCVFHSQPESDEIKVSIRKISNTFYNFDLILKIPPRIKFSKSANIGKPALAFENFQKSGGEEEFHSRESLIIEVKMYPEKVNFSFG